jgi:hypothetical protein
MDIKVAQARKVPAIRGADKTTFNSISGRTSIKECPPLEPK